MAARTERTELSSGKFRRRRAHVASAEAVARAERLASAQRLKPRSLRRGQHRIEPSLCALEERIEPRLHLLANVPEVACLLHHDRIDAALLLGREIERAREPLSHPVTAATTLMSATAIRRKETGAARPEPAAATALVMHREPVGGEAESHAREPHDGE